jgi:glycerol-3-phosphate dehydrogenase subunit B
VSDVVVVGGGIAGLAAALAARREGARVTVIEAHPGATALAGGAWDLGDRTRGPIDTLTERRSVSRLLDELVRREKSHPLALIGGDVSALAKEAHDVVLDALAIYAPLELDRPPSLVATDVGLVRRAASAQRAVLDLDALPEGRIAVANFPAAREHDGAFAAASLGEIAADAGDPRRFCAVEVEMLRRGRDVWLHPHEAGALFDDERARDRLVRALGRALGGAGFDAVLLPPLLGENTDTAWARVRESLAMPVGEWVSSLAGPQSARLTRAIARAFARASASYFRARVRSGRADASGVAIETERETRKPGALVLATGGLFAGGLAFANGEPAEPLFGLPPYVDGKPLAVGSSRSGRDPALFFGSDPFTPGEGFRAGVGIDEQLRPLDAHGRVVSASLFAAGSVLSGVPIAGEGGGLGVAAMTGFVAGRNAARHAAS